MTRKDIYYKTLYSTYYLFVFTYFISLLLDLFVTITVYKYDPSTFFNFEMNKGLINLIRGKPNWWSFLTIIINLIPIFVSKKIGDDFFKRKKRANLFFFFLIFLIISTLLHVFGAVSWLI